MDARGDPLITLEEVFDAVEALIVKGNNERQAYDEAKREAGTRRGR